MRINKYVENEKLTQKVVRDIYIYIFAYIIFNIYEASYYERMIYEVLVITYIVESVVCSIVIITGRINKVIKCEYI